MADAEKGGSLPRAGCGRHCSRFLCVMQYGSQCLIPLARLLLFAVPQVTQILTFSYIKKHESGFSLHVSLHTTLTI